MGLTILRPSKRIYTLGDLGTVKIRRPRITAAAADWWDPNNDGLCVWSAYQPKGATSFAASLLDLSGNGNNAGDPGGAATPAWDNVNGWKFDGIAHYLTTTFVPQNDQTQTAILQFTTVTDGSFFWGAAPTGGMFAQTRSGGDVTYRNGAFIALAPNLAAGNLAVSGNRGYRNGVAEGGAIGAWTAPSNDVVYIGCRSFNAGPANYIAAYFQAFALYDCTLTAPQVLAVATAMALL